MEQYLKETAMLNYSAGEIQKLIGDRQWKNTDEFNRIRQIYNFVRDEILFGYNVDDSIPASKVLADGYPHWTKGYTPQIMIFARFSALSSIGVRPVRLNRLP